VDKDHFGGEDSLVYVSDQPRKRGKVAKLPQKWQNNWLMFIKVLDLQS
jgi:hypothetical protein